MTIILFNGKPYLCRKLPHSWERLTFRAFLRLCWRGSNVAPDSITIR